MLEPTFSACLVVLDNLCEAFGCSVITDLILTVSKVLGWLVIIYYCFTNFLSSFLKIIYRGL